jgi:hypothetical protein
MRQELVDKLPDFLYLGGGVEIGVDHGDFSNQILEKWTGHLFLVDFWKEFEGTMQDEQDRRCQYVKDRFKNDPRVTVIRETSVEASRRFIKGQFDWIYIDADHSYDAVRADLEAWYPLLREGGLFMGHDYLTGASNFQVKVAVDEFAEKLKKNVNVIEANSIWPSWWFVK